MGDHDAWAEQLWCQTSVQAVSNTSWKFAHDCAKENRAEVLHQLYFKYCRSVLKALAVHSLDFSACLTVLTQDGTLLALEDEYAWSDGRTDAPMRLVRLEKEGGTFECVEPSAGAGLPVYCIWANSTGREGVAVVHDIAAPETCVFQHAEDKTDGQTLITYTPISIEAMHKRDRRQTSGTAVSAPVFVLHKGAKVCIGALTIHHVRAGSMNTPPHWVWATQCAETIGKALGFYHARFELLGLFWSGWARDIPAPPSAAGERRNLDSRKLDYPKLRDAVLSKCHANDWSQQDFAEAANIALRRLTDALAGKRCTLKTLNALVKVLEMKPNELFLQP
jgi:hypothetical protein